MRFNTAAAIAIVLMAVVDSGVGALLYAGFADGVVPLWLSLATTMVGLVDLVFLGMLIRAARR